MGIPLKLQVFEGPMDLLMHLIEKNKIDIYDIPIVTITDQYLEYVRQMDHADMNVTSEFLVMAATLLDIKSRMLLPREEDEEGEEGDPRDELVSRLLEYKMYKYMSEELKEKRRTAGFSYFRPQDLPEEVRSYVPPLNYKEIIGDRTVQSLQTVFSEVLKRKKSRVDPVRSGFGKIQREEISVADKELYVRAYLISHPHADFREMLELENSKEEIIVTFLVILELMKHQKIRITQEEAFGKILIDLVEETETTAEPETVEEPETTAEPETTEEPETTAEPESAAAAEPETASEQEPVPELPPEEEPILEPAPAEEPRLISEAPALMEREMHILQIPVTEEEPMPEPEPAAEEIEPPAAEEIEPPAIEETEPPARRRLIGRMKRGMKGIGRHAFPFTAKRTFRNQYRRARGIRLWSRKKYRNRLFRRR